MTWIQILTLSLPSRANYIVCRDQFKMKIGAPFSKMIKNFSKTSADHYTKHQSLLSMDPMQLHRLHAMQPTLLPSYVNLGS